MNLDEIQAALRQYQIDGWLFSITTTAIRLPTAFWG